MSNQEIIQDTERYVMNTYGRQPLAFVRGKGISLFDADDNEYQDFLAGLAVASLGHSHPLIVEALQKQVAELIHTSNLYHIPNQSKLARYLVDLAFESRVFFCNSGTEANEAAIKLARRYHAVSKGAPRPGILAFHNSFHGRTFGALSATGQAKFHKGFAPLLPGGVHVPFNDIGAVRSALDQNPEIGAIILEVVQAEGGINLARPEFLREVRALASERDLVLIFDEVQTGMGRTGRMFAYQDTGVVPDIMTLAKGLGGGVPIGACLASNRVAAGFEPGAHASTFGGNHLTTAAAITVIKALLNDHLVERAQATGKSILERLRAEKRSSMVDIRGKGLLIGIELDQPAAPIVEKMRQAGYLIGTAGERVVRITPPLIVSQSQCASMLDALLRIIR